MRKFLLSLLFVLTLSGTSARAQASIQVQNARVDYIFGDHVLFQAQLASVAGVREGVIFFSAEGDPNTRVDKVSISADGQVSYRYNSSGGALRPFAAIRYTYQFTLNDGQTYTSPQFSFDYIDNRFEWKTISDDLLHIHWYDGDLAFGQYASDVAHLGLQRIQAVLPVQLAHPVDVYIYNNSADMQSALGDSNAGGLAGHTSPDLGVTLVSILPGPEQGLQIDRQIPHELAHVLMYELVRDGYPRIPVWLREGFASEMELSPSPDYPIALSQAIGGGTVIPMNDLCLSFPPDMSGTFLAYAQSASFTHYFVAQYGKSTLVNLLAAYAEGLNCEQGALRAVGMPLSAIDTAWRRDILGEDVALTTFINLLPYLSLLLIIFIVPLLSLLLPQGDQRGR